MSPSEPSAAERRQLPAFGHGSSPDGAMADEGRPPAKEKDQEEGTAKALTPLALASEAARSVIATLGDASAVVLGEVYRRAGGLTETAAQAAMDQANSAAQVAMDQAKGYAELCLSGATYCAGKAKVRARRALVPSSVEARIPPYWRGMNESLGLQVVPVKRMRATLEKLIRPGGTLGGRDLKYKHPEGYKDLKYQAGWRIENPALYFKYSAEREKMRTSIDSALLGGAELPRVELAQAFREAAGELPANLDPELNEVYLVHGTAPERLLQILSGGFNERFAAKGLFGRGIYFAEDVGKVDQYVTPDRDYRSEKDGEDDSMYDLHRLLYDDEASHPQDIFYAVVCRVLLGMYASTRDGQTRVKPGEGDLWSDGTVDAHEARELAYIPHSSPREPFHALVAEKGGKIVRYREFISFHGEVRAYPEYLVAYRRVQPRLP